MTYYRVKPEFDQYDIGGYALLWGELFTAKEMRKNRIPAHVVEAVEVDPSATIIWLGSRIIKDDPNPWRD